MFFKNIEDWSPKKLRMWSVIFNALFICCSLVVPIIVVALKYKLFTKVETQYRMTAVGVIVALIVAIVGFRNLRRLLDKLPQEELAEQRVKFTLIGIYRLAVPCCLAVVMKAFKKDFDIAYNTLWTCMIFYCIALVIDMLFIQYIDAEYIQRRKAKDRIAVDKRVNTIEKYSKKNK